MRFFKRNCKQEKSLSSVEVKELQQNEDFIELNESKSNSYIGGKTLGNSPKTALVLNGGVEGATKVLIGGKLYEGFTGVTYADGKAMVTFEGRESIEVSGLSLESTKDWPCGTKVVDVAFGRTRTIVSKGVNGVVLGGPNGRSLKAGNVEVSFDDLARNYVKEQYASSIGGCTCSANNDED